MLNFLFEQYGYYPNDLVDNQFSINNWIFRLIEIDFDEDYINNVENYMVFMRNKIGKTQGAFLMKNRFDKMISVYDGKKYVLISSYNTELTLQDLCKFHCDFEQKDKNIELNKLLMLWDERISVIEREVIGSFRVDSVYYNKNIEETLFCLGLAQNALQYLSEIIEDYGNELKCLTIVHKRLYDLNSFDFFNPFNFVVDHPIKDLSELYKNDFITFSQLINVIDFYKLDTKIASVFMARILYPVKQMDLLEKNKTKKNVNFYLHYNIDKEIQKIRKIYFYLKKTYNIRPINWLEN